MTTTIKDYAKIRKDAQMHAVAEYVKGKTVRDLLKSPVVEFVAETERERAHAFRARVNVLRYVDDGDAKKTVRESCATIAMQIGAVAVEMRGDNAQPKKHRDAVVAALQEVAKALGLEGLTFGKRDAVCLVEWATRAKADGDLTNTAIAANAWNYVQRVLTNKINAHDASVYVGKTIVG